TEAAAGKAHLRGDSVEDAQLPKMLDDEHDFPQPTGGRGDSFGSGLDDHRRISDTSHVYLLVGKVLYPSLKGGTFYACPLQTRSRCAIRGQDETNPCLLWKPASLGCESVVAKSPVQSRTQVMTA